VLVAVHAAGCSGLVHETWSKPGATAAKLNRDVADCRREARVNPTHGQEQDAYGFSVPRNDRVFAAPARARGGTSPGRAEPRGPRPGRRA
jgi:hypothetical protein